MLLIVEIHGLAKPAAREIEAKIIDAVKEYSGAENVYFEIYPTKFNDVHGKELAYIRLADNNIENYPELFRLIIKTTSDILPMQWFDLFTSYKKGEYTKKEST